jgi:hypothetical protein
VRANIDAQDDEVIADLDDLPASDDNNSLQDSVLLEERSEFTVFRESLIPALGKKRAGVDFSSQLNSIESRAALPPLAMPVINAPAVMPIKAGRAIDHPSRAVITVVAGAVWIVRGITVPIAVPVPASVPDRKAKSDPH